MWLEKESEKSLESRWKANKLNENENESKFAPESYAAGETHT